MPKATTGAGWSKDLKSPELEKALHHKWALIKDSSLRKFHPIFVDFDELRIDLMA